MRIRVGVERVQGVGAEAQRVERSGLLRFDQEVGIGSQASQLLSPRRRLDVDD